jgi:hypothetical protein
MNVNNLLKNYAKDCIGEDVGMEVGVNTLLLLLKQYIEEYADKEEFERFIKGNNRK